MQFLTITFRFEQGFHVKICGRKDYSKGVPLSLIWMFEWHECWNTHWLVMVRLSAWLSSKSRCSTSSSCGIGATYTQPCKKSIAHLQTRVLTFIVFALHAHFKHSVLWRMMCKPIVVMPQHFENMQIRKDWLYTIDSANFSKYLCGRRTTKWNHATTAESRFELSAEKATVFSV